MIQGKLKNNLIDEMKLSYEAEIFQISGSKSSFEGIYTVVVYIVV